MKHPTNYKNTARSIALVAGLSLAMSAKATVPVTDLPDFDNLPNFAMLGNNVLLHNGTVNGNVGVTANGSITKMAPGRINGNLYLATGASVSGPGPISGSTFTGQNLSLEQSTVSSFSSGLAGLTPDVSFGTSQSGSFTYDVPAGQVFVANFNAGLSLSGGNSIMLTGDGILVLNIMGSLGITGGATSILGNPANIYINYLGTSSVNTTGGPTINGQYFTPNAAFTLDLGTMNGAIYGGNQQLQLHSGSTLNFAPIPEPGTLILAGLGGVSMIILRRRLFTLTRSV